MLSLKERLEMLDGFLKETTPEELFEELSHYDAVGPNADSFLSDKVELFSSQYTESIKIQEEAIKLSLNQAYNLYDSYLEFYSEGFPLATSIKIQAETIRVLSNQACNLHSTSLEFYSENLPFAA